ncbi:YopX family protein [Ruminococcus sp.]|uniref:YopX family protein n=1 Tax=Ruminococcus sp. TaxID=41978 RepID=UPI0025F7463E|nr:YopX family protein [Ruminococcus sp.]
MMREILFRGKFGNEWKYGFLSVEPKGLVIKEPYKNESSNVWHIDADTVGQYTGMTDKNGTKIFDGDIVDFSKRPDNGDYGAVIYDADETEFGIEYYNIYRSLGKNYYPENIEVIGNIYDNPELLKGENND